ncbi:MAG: ferrochelatase [Methylobacillus sp.]|jgi:ferrochelatase|nr:ferrochelatase [Methylobacillus sp.]
MKFRPEPPWHHGTPERIGILPINLGSPDAPTARALRPYLKQFLSDPRVIEIPRLAWWPILNGIILNTRPAKSAAKYAQIWTSEGAPLLMHTRKQSTMLKGYLGERGISVEVEFGMRYGNPSIADALEKLRERNCTRILVIPLYPQYAASSTGSALDAVWQELQRMRNMPEVRAVRHYHDDPGYIAALAASVRQHWSEHGRSGKLIMSFHGIPRRSVDLGDPYFCECQKTGRLLAEALGLEQEQYMICFQSRFGRAEWLRPYFAPTLEHLGKNDVRRVDVICPGFAGDCLETLEEIGIEGKITFLGAGGKEYHYIPALNERDDWLHALTNIAERHLQGWLHGGAEQGKAALEQSRLRAMAMGAKR